MGITAFNIDNLGIKAVVKKTGKETAKAILEDYKLQDTPDSGRQVEKSGKWPKVTWNLISEGGDIIHIQSAGPSGFRSTHVHSTNIFNLNMWNL